MILYGITKNTSINTTISTYYKMNDKHVRLVMIKSTYRLKDKNK